MGTDAGVISPELKGPGREAEHLSSSEETRNGLAVPPLRHKSSSHSAYLTLHYILYPRCNIV
jgi:hypothetical protein